VTVLDIDAQGALAYASVDQSVDVQMIGDQLLTADRPLGVRIHELAYELNRVTQR